MVTKIKPALYTTLVFAGISFVAGLFDGAYWLGVYVFFVAGAGNLIYGIPVSLLSDSLTRKMPRGRVVAAGFIHILFGFLSIILLEGAAVFAVINATLFFLFDERLKSKRESESSRRRKIHTAQALTIIPAAVLAVWGIFTSDNSPGVADLSFEEKKDMIYLIPEGYEGAAVTFYNIPGEPELQQEGEFGVVPLSVESLPALMGTDIERYGTYRTSEKMSQGMVNDLYFYVDEEGNRTPIDHYCINNGVYGGSTGASGREIEFMAFQVTNSECGEEFFLDGEDLYSVQEREVIDYWTNLYD
ncbi:DUF6843 domain-containing protein [Bacillus salacetis]|uniref:DUF6843 domain-containing protein n=1 Tax=Bacillus salacetis TaxID=2315464 RepID=UPI003BA2A9D4